ncbi:CPBP family intramembrane metalloprotease [Gracilibacillus salitolerans]|uniref:CPBP family intramembrane metalloprotease n=1 Tax=Gracilibacillus salitolerans TaxID=2663022 RepID=A0A5Q2TGS0_9BACI|nr:type II CAAX endopeptidase family protein [Gracilibacillus salitolerans]QGH33140.1 CPBP family intramembrane metalloprotease [Gracilibacillus salitolerans]
MPRKYIYLIITYVAMQLSSILALPFLPYIEDRDTFSVAWSVMSFAVALVISLIVLRDEMQDFFQAREKKVWTIILWSFLGFILVMISQYVAIAIETFVFGIQPGSENTMDLMNVARQAPIFIVIISVFGPILEELVFRKAIFGSLYKRMNFFLAALLSGVIFAAVHMDFEHILTYTAVGMVFSFLYVETKRIIVPIIAHMSINTFAVIAQLSVDPEELERQLEQMEQLMMILIGG